MNYAFPGMDPYLEHPVLWEGDYPHANTSWPGARKETEEIFAAVPPDESAMIFHENAERLFKWTCPEPEALQDAPTAFGSTYEWSLTRVEADWRRRLAGSAMFGASEQAPLR